MQTLIGISRAWMAFANIEIYVAKLQWRLQTSMRFWDVEIEIAQVLCDL